MPEKININGKEYTLSPLRLKHLRRINDTLKEPPSGSIAVLLDRYSPYITASIQGNDPDFKKELLEELTFEEFLNTWQLTLRASGIIVQKKEGEIQPEATSSGAQSTDASVSPSAGTIVQ
jgi:hypothetical protein